jgi:hypothetical protein
MGWTEDRRSGSGRWSFVAVGVALVVLITASCSSPTHPAPAEPKGSDEVVTISSCETIPCQGTLGPGTYRTAFYDQYGELTYPVINFTTPDRGWTWYYSGNLRIVLDDTPTEGLYSSEGIYFLLHPSAAATSCEEVPEPGVGRSVEELADWLGQLPGLAITGRRPVTIGGLRGVRLDLALNPAWSETCPWSEGMPAVPLIVRAADFGGYHYALIPGNSMRWFLLPWEGGTMVIDIDNSKGGMTAEALIEAATPIVRSLEFSTT